MNRNFFKGIFALALAMMLGGSAARAQQAKMFALDEVRITGGEMLARQEWDERFILSLDADRLLFHFRQQAGVENPAGVQPYGGWEATDLKGHTLGHWLTALSLMAGGQASTPALQSEAKRRIEHVVGALAECQAATGTGYVSAFSERMLDVADATGQGWAPYYTLHKILQGLIDAYAATGNAQALAVADRFGDYIYGRTRRVDLAQWPKVMDIMEVGGFADALLNLYALTHKQIHFDAGHFFQQWDKIVPAAEGRDQLHVEITDNYKHANGTIPQFTAALREYGVTGNDTLLAAARNFWHFVVDHRTYSNGTTGFHEHWNYGPDQLSREMDLQAGETCCTYNMIRLSHGLFCQEPRAEYAEYVERATLNDIMGSIEPETANFMYFHTQKPGGFKIFGPNAQVFWCCTGTGMENHLRYASGIYFHAEENAPVLFVNQFFPSQVQWREAGLVVRQEGDFPLAEQSSLIVAEGTADAEIRIRVPRWCEGFALKINGKKVKTPDIADGYCTLRRTWQAGDCIDIALPMRLHAEPLKDEPAMASILYGPLVLAADLGKDGVTPDLIHSLDYFYEEIPEPWQVHFEVPAMTGSMRSLKWLKQRKGALEFTTERTSDGSRQTLRPLYQISDTRFADYWRFSKAK